MRLSLRLILFLVAGITLVTFLVARNEVRSEKRGLRADLERRAGILAESLQEIVEPALERGSRDQLRRVVERFSNRERLAGVVVYDDRGQVLAESSNLTAGINSVPVPLEQLKATDTGIGEFRKVGDTQMHVYFLPLHSRSAMVGVLAIFHDASYIEAQSVRIWRETLWHVIAQVLLIVLITILIIRWTIILPISRTAQWMKDLRIGRTKFRPSAPKEDFLAPFSQEVLNMARSLAEARAAAEEEARLRETGESKWTPERLRVSIQSKTNQSRLFVVSNREPYMHVHRGKEIEAIVPASGLVTALEPILRACNGTWIASGSGDADRETVDAQDRLRVPPEEPEYTLRRVWLTKEEDEGYYYGFSNEGLWPLCHIAFTRPIFRATDWQSYQDVNRKFADAVLAEMAGAEKPLLLVQDYHFALLPRLVKEARPDARIAIFWHIPWPNPEAFGICPWERELLDGLLGADLIGFHIQAHCNNFLETVDAALESRIEWEHFAVKRHGQTTLVRPFPISVDFRETEFPAEQPPSPYVERATLLKKLGIEASFLGVGVDRVDYTKGILERFRGIERFLEKCPNYVGKFTFVEIGAPSRTHIPRYHDFLNEVEQEAARINFRFQSDKWKPIALLTRHHGHSEIQPYYRAADLCMVTSLHDGMNLVAKEFIAAREDEEGALILSQFTGACRELRDALVVNPYDIEQLSDAIRLALEMSPDDRHARMQRMRRTVREHNVYRWAGNLIAELSEIRIGEAEPATSDLSRVV
ncbi:MAG TPA: trehalose-6-phosphate synthase [Candidatus Limnocylindrales bacterium]|nr:trehalose-6-phosphate synthase [Candidatus Limnocylindrales bacterium]